MDEPPWWVDEYPHDPDADCWCPPSGQLPTEHMLPAGEEDAHDLDEDCWCGPAWVALADGSDGLWHYGRDAYAVRYRPLIDVEVAARYAGEPVL